MSDDRLFDPARLRLVRLLACGTVALFALATFGVVAAFPLWQTVVAAACTTALVPVLWLALGSMLAPLRPGVPSSRYLASAGWSVLGLALLVTACLMFATAPVG